MAPKKKGKGKKAPQRTKKKKKETPPSGGGGDPAVTPALERGHLAGLRGRPDLNGRRVEVKGQTAGKDRAPRFRVEVLFGAGAGTVLKVKAANLELDKDRVLDPALNTLVAAMQALAPGATPPEERDWAGGLPIEVLAKIAETHVARTEAGVKAFLKQVPGWTERCIQERMAKRKADGNCLFVFAMVCKGWRKAQLRVRGRLRTRMESDVAMQGGLALAKWALAEGCPREHENGHTNMAYTAAEHGHLELAKCLFRKQGFAMTTTMIEMAARGGNLDLVRWLRGEGCPWDMWTSDHAVDQGHVEVLRWLRENGCPWTAAIRHRAAWELGYTDNFDW